MRLINLAAAAAAATVAASVSAQRSTLDHPVSEYRAYHSDSGMLPNAANQPATVFHEEIHIQNAGWLRVYFGEVELAPGSFVRITSKLDGEVQDLDAGGMFMWKNSSGYFNGDTVVVELIATGNTEANRVVIEQLEYQPLPAIPAGGPGQCGICGLDDRVPSSEEWTARLFPAGCTASVYNEDSCMVSAGHCIGGNMVVQFNVPNSTAGCFTLNPPLSEQFPATALAFTNGGVGNDWSVLEAGVNNLGEKPYDRYGVLRPIARVPAPFGAAVDLTGYGVDLTCILSQTQQTSDGTITGVGATHYEFNVDLRGGNSGSALIRNDEIIGIATHCSVGCPNFATRVDRVDFTNARDLCPSPEPPEPMPIATGNNSAVNGYLLVSPDAYGSFYSPFGGGQGPHQDRFNPGGTPGALSPAFTAGFFLFNGGQRELLSDSVEWQSIVSDSSLNREIISDLVASDTDGDAVDDTVVSSFRVFGGSTDLTFDLTQHVENVSGAVSLLTQTHVITNNSGSLINFTLVRTYDGDLSWSGDFQNDTVGTGTNSSPLERFVFIQEPGDVDTAITISSSLGDDYYGGKHGVDPDGGGGSPPYDYGTDTEVWDAFGVPTGWRNHIAGVGYNSDGNSGSTPPGSTNPEDAFIGLDIPVSLGAGMSTTVTLHHTYGDDEPAVTSKPCPWDCADGNGDVGITDFLKLLADWGMVSPCDFDGGGVGITDFLKLLANWGACP